MIFNRKVNTQNFSDFDLQICLWSVLNPSFDIWKSSNSLVQIYQLGIFLIGLLGKITKVHEHNNVSPGQVVANKVLSTSTHKPLLKLIKSQLKGDLVELLQALFVLGKVELDPGVDEVLDQICNEDSPILGGLCKASIIEGEGRLILDP